MSLITRIFGKDPSEAEAPDGSTPPAKAEAPPPPDPAARLREEEASLSQALEAGDLAAVGRWVLEGSSTRLRQQAARHIDDPDQLRELIRATRHGNDKTVHRILTDRRDSQLAEMRRLEQQQAEVDTAAAAIARHAALPCDETYEAALRGLEARWRGVAPHASADLQREVTQQLERAHELIAQHREATEAEAERRRAAARAAEEALRQAQLEAEAAAAAAAEQARLMEAERAARVEAERARRGEEEAEARHLLGLLRQAQAALERGSTARAARLRDAIAEKLPQAPALPEWYARQLQHVDERLGELKDWKTFRVAPRRAELIERMHSLVGAEISPEELARQIRKLREEWRTLHRGAGEEPSPEWQQFDEAAERAYEPCRVHFARQAEQRRENQARREALLERLAAFAATQSGEQRDLPLIRRVLVEAREEWQQHAPVDQSVVKPLQASFHALLHELQAMLESEFARNVQAKRDLVARAAELVKLEDTRRAIDEAKSLQRAWKTAGPVPRAEDNALWQEFRHHCDAVFQRSAQEWAAHGAVLETSQARAVALCEELERISGLGGEPLTAAAKALDGLRDEFESLELPRAHARELRQRFRQASDHCLQAVRRARDAAARRGWTDLLDAAAQVRAYALASVEGTSADECDVLRSSAATAVADLAHAPKGTRAILERLLDGIAAGTVSTDLAANEAALRLLCIRAELIADLETPPEDLQRRRDYQMQRLVAAMGKGERPTPADLDDLAREWLAVGPVATTVHDALYARFERCRGDGGHRR